jgi:predicted peptidase
MFLANNGYAVCDCSHLTNIHTEITESKQLPSIVSTTASLIRFIQMNYNVETDGIYIVGKSAGGFVCMLLP